MEKIRVLLVEDDEITAKYICEFLIECGFDVDYVDTITSGISNIKYNGYDILLLDLNLPDFSGFELLRSIKDKYTLPIMILSAFSDTKTKVEAFNQGASDYMVKPIDLEELEVRIWSLLDRFRTDSIVKKEKELFAIEGSNIIFKDSILKLTSIEFEIMSLLVKHKNQTISREVLADSLSSISSIRSLDHHIKNIRKKLSNIDSEKSYLKTEYGVGYRLIVS